MKRRSFISSGLVFTGGAILAGGTPFVTGLTSCSGNLPNTQNLYTLFKKPDLKYHPFVRWWWNGDKIEKDELIRELHLLKDAGIGGVEINPIEFPGRIEGDDLGIPSKRWLSDEWIEMLQVTFAEAKKLGLTCDLIVGSGWPFGSESLLPEERAEVVILDADLVEGPVAYKRERSDILKAIDPKVTVPFPDRTFEVLSIKMVSDPMSSLDEVIDLSEKIDDETISIDIPEGKFGIYTLVKVSSFATVINGAPGAAGPILNHMDKKAVEKYLLNMSETISKKTGPLSDHLRAFFTDSMELEGCNWTSDFAEEFQNRRGYDIMEWLPFIMFKVGRLGGVINDKYGVAKEPLFDEELSRVRYDFEFTKAELLYERFTLTYLEWCRNQNVKSRAQAYGRGFFPLETSIGYDIPEGESWTTNWLKHRVGEEMPNDDYRRGRAYTMINKYVSSAAHLAGNRVVSCEEMTNTYLVFTTSLERLKTGSDQSIISGITHSVWHGFNYSPPEAPYPGWIQYGSYLNEKNNWWPYFKHLNLYKARISSLLQNADMFTDIAILPANNDMWGTMGVQTDPFPEKLNVPYTSLLWEAITKNGGGADYTSEMIINKSEVVNGKLCYGNKKYEVLFLPGVKSINPETLQKLYSFVESGGRVFCIDTYPEKSLGLKNYVNNDKEIQELVKKLKLIPERFVFLEKPTDNEFLSWYTDIMNNHNISSYIKIDKPDPFLMQTRYTTDDKREVFFFVNANTSRSYSTHITFSKEITRNRSASVWDPETGNRNGLELDDGRYDLNMGPSESLLVVFDRDRVGAKMESKPTRDSENISVLGPWDLRFNHCRGVEVPPIKMQTLSDLKEIPEYVHFSGTIIYTTSLQIKEPDSIKYIDIGKVYGVAELLINEKSCGIKWYGNRLFRLENPLMAGENKIEIRVVTEMGNYMKSLIDNPVAQYWTNLARKNQPIASMGLIGPVECLS